MNFYFNELLKEQQLGGAFSQQKIHSLMNLIYIILERDYSKKEKKKPSTYLQKALAFEHLIEKNFLTIKSPGNYAKQLNITEKHLNRITRASFNKTSTALIGERVILEAKRMLIQSKLNVSEVGFELGFDDPSYFVRFFKKHTHQTPLEFLNSYSV